MYIEEIARTCNEDDCEKAFQSYEEDLKRICNDCLETAECMFCSSQITFRKKAPPTEENFLCITCQERDWELSDEKPPVDIEVSFENFEKDMGSLKEFLQ